MEKIKYNFYLGKINKNPCIEIISSFEHFSGEINNLSGNELRDIVDRLERVKLGTKNDCLFGGELSFINCRRKAEDEEYIPGKITCIIDYGFGEDNHRINVDFEDIYNLMKDWKEYVEKWEQETGLEKKGLWD